MGQGWGTPTGAGVMASSHGCPAGTLPVWTLDGVSYDLVFWKQDESEERSPRGIFESFSEDQRVSGVPPLPVEALMARLLDTFPYAVRESHGGMEWLHWVSEDSRSSFEVVSGPQCVWVSLRPLDETKANRIIEVANEFGCALYDPQIDQRFGLLP